VDLKVGGTLYMEWKVRGDQNCMWTGNLGVGANFGSEHESQAFKTNKQNKRSFGFKYTLLPLDLLINFLLP
jgi:hypothetical protein